MYAYAFSNLELLQIYDVAERHSEQKLVTTMLASFLHQDGGGHMQAVSSGCA